MNSDQFLEWVMAAALAVIMLVGLIAMIGMVAIELVKAMP